MSVLRIHGRAEEGRAEVWKPSQGFMGWWSDPHPLLIYGFNAMGMVFYLHISVSSFVK